LLVSDNSKCIRTFEGGRGLTSNFLCGGGMDVFWNDPFRLIVVISLASGQILKFLRESKM
jgi:hypothetical protein